MHCLDWQRHLCSPLTMLGMRKLSFGCAANWTPLGRYEGVYPGSFLQRGTKCGLPSTLEKPLQCESAWPPAVDSLHRFLILTLAHHTLQELAVPLHTSDKAGCRLGKMRHLESLCISLVVQYTRHARGLTCADEPSTQPVPDTAHAAYWPALSRLLGCPSLSSSAMPVFVPIGKVGFSHARSYAGERTCVCGV